MSDLSIMSHRPIITGHIGSIHGMSSTSSTTKRQLTHIEIRRAQNGFVVRGVQTNMGYDEDGNQVFFVCESVESLTNLIASLATDEGDFVWGAGHDLRYEDIFKEKKA